MQDRFDMMVQDSKWRRMQCLYYTFMVNANLASFSWSVVARELFMNSK